MDLSLCQRLVTGAEGQDSTGKLETQTSVAELAFFDHLDLAFTILFTVHFHSCPDIQAAHSC